MTSRKSRATSSTWWFHRDRPRAGNLSARRGSLTLAARFQRLLRVFIGRIFHGGGDSGASEMDVALGVVLILLACPASWSLFFSSKNTARSFAGCAATVSSTRSPPRCQTNTSSSSCQHGRHRRRRCLALGRALPGPPRLYEHRSDANLAYANFLGNLSAILLLAGALTLDVNAASFVLFPVAVVGSQNSLSLFLRFGAGHAVTVVLASAFSFFAVFAVIGLLMAVLPYALFRRISLYVRFRSRFSFSPFSPPVLPSPLSSLNHTYQ